MNNAFSAAVMAGALLTAFPCGTLPVFAQSGKTDTPEASMNSTSMTQQAGPRTPQKNESAVFPKSRSAQKIQKSLQAGGCASACPKCLRTCVLNVSHYGPHECSEGHTWDGHDSQRPSPCISTCPVCLRSCVLNLGHYSPHECSEGHTWN
ncbi:MAG: hypothetical protein NTZ78_14950 [Candidatus Aureabacteria bacterium]|nr:hypothetical protein [Candidatus Auribacterota bacterium]